VLHEISAAERCALTDSTSACAQDIEAVDPEYYKNLRWMLENPIADVLDLTFTEEVDYFGAVELVELKPGGAGIKARAPT
jgi:hypothetical protein